MSETAGEVPAQDGPAGIGGWLLLPLAHLALYACVLLIGFVRLSAQLVPGFVDATSPAPLIAGDTAAFALGCLLMAGYAVYCLARAFGRRRNAPRLMAAFFLLTLAAAGLNRDVMLRMGAPETSATALLALIGTMVAVAGWVPYLLVSQRVRNTFVA